MKGSLAGGKGSAIIGLCRPNKLFFHKKSVMAMGPLFRGNVQGGSSVMQMIFVNFTVFIMFLRKIPLEMGTFFGKNDSDP